MAACIHPTAENVPGRLGIDAQAQARMTGCGRCSWMFVVVLCSELQEHRPYLSCFMLGNPW